MIHIPINIKNIELCQSHFNHIRQPINDLINNKINVIHEGSFEHIVLTHIQTNLDNILIADVNQIEQHINLFINLIHDHIGTVVLTENDYASKSISLDELKIICRDAGISNYSNKNKEMLAGLIWSKRMHINDINDQNNKLKFSVLKTKINLILTEIFVNFYESAWDNIENYTRYDFVKKLDLNTCPYCNRNYTFVVDKNNGNLRPEIDHFHPKSIYPFLAMSFYNLIPSCCVCNHTKKDKDSFKLGLANPYQIQENEFKITYKPKQINFMQLKRKNYNFDSFKIEFKKANEVNLDIFKLEKLYEQHRDIVLDLLMKKAYYPESYIEELKKNYKFSKDDIYRFLLSNYSKSKDLHKRPLSKLTKDIAEELGLILSK